MSALLQPESPERVESSHSPSSGFGQEQSFADPLFDRREDVAIAEVAERVGYGSASTFSTAFSRRVGQPPSRYAGQR